MLWVYVVGNIVKNGKCAPQHIIYCGEHKYVVDNIDEHVLHNIGTCCPQHVTHNKTTTCSGRYNVENEGYVVGYMLWTTLMNIFSTTQVSVTHNMNPQHVTHNIANDVRNIHPQHVDVVHNM